MTPESKANLLVWTSRVALAASVVALLFIAPLCYCFRYYVALSVAGIIPLLCGPRLYRWFGGAYMLAALLFAVGEHRAASRQTEEIQHMKASAQVQHP
jgi:hypothetical protein